jgi:hypothetical protein
MQTVAEHLTQDFETHPAGTGKELARLSDRVRNLESALADFVECVDSTGGIYSWDNGQTAPLVDKDWTDLGGAYKKAKAALAD